MLVSAMAPYIPSVGGMVSNIASHRSLVMTTMALLAISQIPTVAAGPIAYAQCLAVSGPWGPVVCLPLLFVPGP